MIKIALPVIFLLIPINSIAQDWQSVFMLDANSGYTSNTYLNTYLSEWDRTTEVGFMTFSPLGQLAYTKSRFSSDITAGYIYQPFFDDREAWSGYFSILGARYKVADRISLGLESGLSQFSTFFDRDIFWIQPVLTWSPNVFTQLRFKAGSSFRKLGSDELENGETVRFDSYSFEFENWPNFKWQLRSSLFGSLNDPSASLGLRASADYWVSKKFQVKMGGALERYQYQVMAQNGGGGTPPIGGGETTMEDADILLKGGVGATYHVTPNIALSLQGDYLNYSSSATGESTGDMFVSAGVRFSLFPKLGERGRADIEWQQNDIQTIILKLNHPGEGELYILGDFNDWEHPGVALSKQSRNRYAAQLSLDPGVYEYKILWLDGSEEKWIEFSDETYTVSDGFGGENGLIFID